MNLWIKRAQRKRRDMTCVIGGGLDPVQQRWYLLSSRWVEAQRASVRGPSRRRVLSETGGALPDAGVIHPNWTDIRDSRGGSVGAPVLGWRRGWSGSEEEQSFQGKSKPRKTFLGDPPHPPPPRSSPVLFKSVPSYHSRGVPVPSGSRKSTFRGWTCVRSSAGMRSPSCCAASLASSPGRPSKVFALIQTNLQCLTLTAACWRGRRF